MTANDLRDQRALLLDKLSSMMNISYREVPSGFYSITGVEIARFEVYAGTEMALDRDYAAYEVDPDVLNHNPTDYDLPGNLLVDHKNAFLLQYGQEDDGGAIVPDLFDEFPDGNYMVAQNAPIDQENHKGVHSIRLADGTRFALPDPEDGSTPIIGMTQGTMMGYMKMRDGETPEQQGIPYFVKQLDRFVWAFVNSFNGVHAQGQTMPPSGVGDGEQGGAFFAEDGLNARTFNVEQSLQDNPYLIAASSEAVYVGGVGEAHAQTGNNENALNLILRVKESINIVDEEGVAMGSFEGFYRSFLSSLATTVAHANEMTESYYVNVDSLESQRVSVSGVSIDEEMTNMIRFQHAYSASARTITAMDEALDILINRTGRVGL
jgi:flagellar hook-associated protein FlgK